MVELSEIEQAWVGLMWDYAEAYPDPLWTRENPGSVDDVPFCDARRERTQGIIDGMAMVIFSETNHLAVETMTRELINLYRERLKKEE